MEDVSARSPSPAALFEREEARHRAPTVLENVRGKLSGIQRRWFAAFRLDVSGNGTLNLSRVAQQMGKNRSSAQRALDAIRTQLRLEGVEGVIDVPIEGDE